MSCKAEECNLHVYSLGFCKSHYNKDYYARNYIKKSNRAKRTPPHPLKNTYRKMLYRCYDPKSYGYRWYGARGIRVCDRWLEKFDNFLADMGNRPEGMTLDRIDPDGDYEPSNCRWATWKEQNNNQRTRQKLVPR